MQSLWMLVAALMFSAMGVCVKLATATYSVWEVVLYRGMIGLVFMVSMMAATRPALVQAIRTRHLGMHVRRGLAGTIALTLWFFSIAGLPIATATTLNYSSPLFVGAAVAFKRYRMGQRPDVPMLAALLVGFAGVVILMHPTLARNQGAAALFGMISAGLSAIAYLSVKALSAAGEPEDRVVFYFSGTNLLTGLIGCTLTGLHGPWRGNWAALLGVGVCATLGQLALTRAYGSGRALLTANLSFTTILFSALWGWLLFGDAPGATAATGMVIILVAGILATIQSSRRLSDRGVS